MDLVHERKSVDAGEVRALGLTEGDAVGIDRNTSNVLECGDVGLVGVGVVNVTASAHRGDHGLEGDGVHNNGLDRIGGGVDAELLAGT